MRIRLPRAARKGITVVPTAVVHAVIAPVVVADRRYQPFCAASKAS